jgi:hypothetical protein
MQLAMSNFQVRQAVATGRWTAEHVAVTPLEAEKARGKIRVAGGLARLDDIELEQGNGRARGGLEFQLDYPQDLIVEFTAESWPVQFKDRPLAILADSQANLHVNVVSKAVEGQMRLSGRVWFQDQDLPAYARYLAEGRTLDVQDLYVEASAARWKGQADQSGSLERQHGQPDLARLSLSRFSDGGRTEEFAGEVPEASWSSRPASCRVHWVPCGSPWMLMLPRAIWAAEVNLPRCRISGRKSPAVNNAIIRIWRPDRCARAVSAGMHAYWRSAITDFNSLIWISLST